MKNLLKKLFKTEDGLETVEYAVMAGLIVAALLITIGNLGGAIDTKFKALITAIGG